MKRRTRLVLLVLTLVAIGVGANAAYRSWIRPLFGAKVTVPVEGWKINAGVTLRPAALATGESLIVVAEGTGYRMILADRTGKQVWLETLMPDILGSVPTSRGLLVYSPGYVRYYEARGLVWQWKADATVISAFAVDGGAALVSCKSGSLESDPRAVPFSERIVYIDQRGKKAWDKPPVDRALIGAGSSADGEILVTTSLTLGASTEACISTYRRNGTAISEVRGEGSAFSGARVSPSGDLAVAGLVGRLTGATATGRWYYQLTGEPRSLSMGSKQETVCLVKPRSRYPVFDLIRSPHLVAVSAQGSKIWDTRLPSTSYAAWTDANSSLTVVASKDGLTGYDSAGNRVWRIQTQAEARSVTFYPDGSFLSVSGSGTVIHYGR